MQSLAKLHRLYKTIADKKLELGLSVNNNNRFSVVISSSGIDELEDGLSSEQGGTSALTSDADGQPALPYPDRLIFGSPGGGGGFPKEMPWENPSVKFTPETLQQLFGEQVASKRSGMISTGAE